MKIGFFSDFLLDDNIEIENELVQIIRNNDLNCLNLEGSFIKSEFTKKSKGIGLYNKTIDLSFFKKNKFKIVNLANNHIFDFGLEGFEFTKKILNNNNIKHFGAGRNALEANKPVIIRNNDVEIGFFGFAWDFTDAINYNNSTKGFGTNPVDIDIIKKILSQYKDVDYKVAYFHFGTEYEDYPEPYQKYIIEELFSDDLLDIVIGNHSHCIQGYKFKKGKLAIYSLGNFILPENKYINGKLSYPEKSHIGYFVIVNFSQKINFEIFPYKLTQNSNKVIMLNEKDYKNFKSKIRKISKPLSMNYKQYRNFYKKNRYRKFRPLMTKNKKINNTKKEIAKAYYFIKRNIYIIIKKSLKKIGVFEKIKQKIK